MGGAHTTGLWDFANSRPDAIRDEFSSDRHADWHGEGNVWEAYRRTCAPGTAARRLFSSYRASSTNKISHLAARNEEFVFDSGIAGAYSFCANPWAHYNQGHFFSDWRTISALFPMFSPAKAAGYSDIRIPSHYYYAQTRRYTYGWDPVNLQLQDVDGMETAWEDKSDKIFWRGASTGGGSSPPGFSAQYQRHRCMALSDLCVVRSPHVIYGSQVRPPRERQVHYQPHHRVCRSTRIN